MAEISAKIRENEEMLSVHNLLLEMIPTWAEESPERWLPELEDTLEEAYEALDRLRKLKGALEELALELGDVKCMMSL
jgi:NTP pyrophosphatase (non-canonical NTP hydrolase)